MDRHNSPPDAVPQRPHVFKGALALNQRSLLTSLNTLIGVNPNQESLRDRPMTAEELSSVLMTVEMLAMSNAMLLDGTLPADDLTALEARLDTLRLATDVTLEVQLLRPDRTQLRSYCAEAAECACLTMREALAGRFMPGDRPYPALESFDRFCGDILRTSEAPTDEARIQVADELVDVVYRGEESYRGSKCVAAIIAARPQAFDLLREVAPALRPQDDRARLLAGALINRFRVNYINALASLRSAAYMADPSIEDLKSAQVILFWRYVVDRMSSAGGALDAAAVPPSFDTVLRAAPLGVALLVNSTGRGPAALLTEALEQRRSPLMTALAKETPQSRFLHQLDEEQFDMFRHELFRKAFSNLERESRATALQRNARRIQIPVVLGGAAGAALGPVLENLAPGIGVGASAGLAAAGAAAGSIAERLLGAAGAMLPGAKRQVYVDAYADLRGYLETARGDLEIAGTIAQSVRRVFGRELAAPSA